MSVQSTSFNSIHTDIYVSRPDTGDRDRLFLIAQSKLTFGFINKVFLASLLLLFLCMNLACLELESTIEIFPEEVEALNSWPTIDRDAIIPLQGTRPIIVSAAEDCSSSSLFRINRVRDHDGELRLYYAWRITFDDGDNTFSETVSFGTVFNTVEQPVVFDVLNGLDMPQLELNSALLQAMTLGSLSRLIGAGKTHRLEIFVSDRPFLQVSRDGIEVDRDAGFDRSYWLLELVDTCD